MGQEMQWRRLGTSIVRRDLAQDVVFGRFGVLNEYVEIATLSECAADRIDQLEFGAARPLRRFSSRSSR